MRCSPCLYYLYFSGRKIIEEKFKVEQRTKSMEEMNRIQEIIKLQNLLDSLGTDTTREHFKSGKNGAVV